MDQRSFLANTNMRSCSRDVFFSLRPGQKPGVSHCSHSYSGVSTAVTILAAQGCDALPPVELAVRTFRGHACQTHVLQ